MTELKQLQTEKTNPKTEQLDCLDALQIVSLMNEADKEVPALIEPELPIIARAVDLVVRHLKQGGRLFYVGAGTSGRLGVLDASECPPTFGVSKDMIQGLIAGGSGAVNAAKEEAEDSEELAISDLQRVGLNEKDIVMALSASGRTPYCISALKYAETVGAGRIALSCNKNAKMSPYAEVAIEVETGPEVVMGSTRLKAGTAQKLVLNMISTASMVRMGKVYRNLMVDMKPSNLKLRQRAIRMVMLAAELEEAEAVRLLEAAEGHVKTAIVMALANADVQTARSALSENDGFVRRAVEALANK